MKTKARAQVKMKAGGQVRALAFLAFLLLPVLARAASDPSGSPSYDVGSLPVHEVPASGGGDLLALFITGDGGWASLDRGVSAALAERGIAVVGLSSLEYFLHAKDAERSAQDVERILRHYLSTWRRSRIVLIGYSFGADVLPFVANRLPDDLRTRIVSLSLLGPSGHASFDISLLQWLPGEDEGGVPVEPELDRLGGLPVLCIYGEGEKVSLCPKLSAREATAVRIGEGHHFSGDYERLATQIVAFADSAARPGARPSTPDH